MSQGCTLDHWAWLIANGFRTITDSVIILWSWNFIHLLPMSQGCILLILSSKGQGHGAWLIVNGFRTITDSVIILTLYETSYTYSPWVKDAPFWFWGQKVKGQGNGAWLIIKGYWTITDSVINLQYTYSPWVKDAPCWFWGQKVKG